MEILLVLLIIALFIELFYTPRIGVTRNKDVLLWFNWGHNRQYIKLFTF